MLNLISIRFNLTVLKVCKVFKVHKVGVVQEKEYL